MSCLCPIAAGGIRIDDSRPAIYYLRLNMRLEVRGGEETPNDYRAIAADRQLETGVASTEWSWIKA
jgi:hypothetical protein